MDLLFISKRKPIRFGIPLLLALMLLSVISILGAVPSAYAATDLSSWCSGPGLSWDGGTLTCTVSGTTPTMSSDVEISSGETLLIAGGGSLTINSGVTLTVDGLGHVTIENSVATPGIANSGTFTNSGTIAIENSGTEGVFNIGNFTNSGTTTIDSSGSYGIYNIDPGSITNSGTIGIGNTGFIGLYSYMSTITNSNSGLITIENSGSGSWGIDNEFGNAITNSGIINIENSGASSYGIYNVYPSTIADTCSATITIVPPGTISGFTYPVTPTGNCAPVTTKVCDQTTTTCAASGLLKGTLGDSFYDTTNLAQTGPFPPMGTVTYHFYSGGTCSAVDEITGTIGVNIWPYVVTVTSKGSVPNSAVVTPLKPGTYSFMAVYSGDAYYDPSSSTCSSASLESFVVTSVYPIGVLGVLAPLGALIVFVSLTKRKTRALDVK
jgi:hypothetical protein